MKFLSAHHKQDDFCINNTFINKALFTSKSAEWETPQKVFNDLNEIFRFELDVCATKDNAKCRRFYTKKQNGLQQIWARRNWMNPPYGKQIGLWIAMAYAEALKGKLTVALLPARTDTRWFHNYIYSKHEVRFIKGRLKFGNSKNSAPFPSMIVIFKPSHS